jgi:hypothetical protein
VEDTVICLTDQRRKRLGPRHLRVVECDCLKPATQAETAQKPGETEDKVLHRTRRELYANAGGTLTGAHKGPDWE